MTEPAEHQTGLLECCRYLAQQAGQEKFSVQLGVLTAKSGVAGRKETLEDIIGVGRRAGLQAVIQRPETDYFAVLVDKLPVVVEFRDGRYLLITGIHGDAAGMVESVTLTVPQVAGKPRSENITISAFLKVWAGGTLHFERINTALVCFSIVAREHKVELTRDRLLHEYGLTSDEIPQNTLLRMAKELGLKAKCIKLNWQDLLNLQKAYPVIARLSKCSSFTWLAAHRAIGDRGVGIDEAANQGSGLLAHNLGIVPDIDIA